jgi:chromosome segregation ATPase
MALSVIIGGAVGASFGKALSDTHKSIGDLRQKTERETTRLSDAMASLQKIDLSRTQRKGVEIGQAFRKAQAGTADFGQAFRASQANTTDLGKRLAALRTQAKTVPELGGEVKRLSAEFNKSKEATEKLRTKWQSSASKANTLREWKPAGKTDEPRRFYLALPFKIDWLRQRF